MKEQVSHLNDTKLIFFSPWNCAAFSGIHNKGMKEYFSLVLGLFFFSHADCVYSVVFNLTYQVVDLNINNDVFLSQLCELLDNSCVYGIHLCVVLSWNEGYHTWSTWVIWVVFAQTDTHRHEVSASTLHWSEKIHRTVFLLCQQNFITAGSQTGCWYLFWHLYSELQWTV